MSGSKKLRSVATENSPLLSHESSDGNGDKYTKIKETAVKCAQTHLPITSWLPKYSFISLLRDIIAGLTVGLMVVPQGLAYATIAGLPVQYGLYSAWMGCFVYCVFGGSKDITLGPTAIMSLMVSRYAKGQPLIAIASTLLCGIFQLSMGILQLGFLVRFISLPVISGFVSAAAITIGFGQVKSLLGLHNIPRDFIPCVYKTFKYIKETNLWDLLLGSCCIVILAVLKKLNRIKWDEDEDVTTLQRVCRKFLWLVSTARNFLVVLLAAAISKAVESAGSENVFSMTPEVEPGIPDFKVRVYSFQCSMHYCDGLLVLSANPLKP